MGWIDYGWMPPCLAEAATTVVARGSTSVLANISTGSYYCWPPGDVPLRVANVTRPLEEGELAGAHADIDVFPMAVLEGIGPPNGRYVKDYVSEALLVENAWEFSAVSQFTAAVGAVSAHAGGGAIAPASMLTLDALLLDGEQLPAGVPPSASVDVVKIDVTGFECHVLEGGSRALFHKLRPKVIVVNVQKAASEACVTALAERHEFDVHRLPLPLASGNTSNGVPTSRFRYDRGKHVMLIDRRP